MKGCFKKMEIRYMGFKVIQSSYNYHICIYKNNNLVMHISAARTFTKNELIDLVRFYLIMKENI